MSTTLDIYTFRTRSVIALVASTLVSAVGFLWPFFIDAGTTHRGAFNEMFFYLALPVALTVLILELSNKGLDVKSVALLGVLAAVTAALRPLGAGAIGLEPMWFILILSARVFGPAFGFVLGIVSLFVSAIFTGGFGPWLAYQMFAAGWIGLGAGLLPKKILGRTIRGWSEIILLMVYGIFAALLFGLLMDLQFWPWAIGTQTQLSYIAGANISENAHRFIIFHFATAMAWDIPRAIFTSLLILLAAPSVLSALRRTHRKAAFLSPIEFREIRATTTSREIRQTEL
ncbi:MAG: ECF transporter S component [Actinobacteria bacterium]|nr:ECF transporter S component [Actinomycetota bacterium]